MVNARRDSCLSTRPAILLTGLVQHRQSSCRRSPAERVGQGVGQSEQGRESSTSSSTGSPAKSRTGRGGLSVQQGAQHSNAGRAEYPPPGAQRRVRQGAQYRESRTKSTAENPSGGARHSERSKSAPSWEEQQEPITGSPAQTAQHREPRAESSARTPAQEAQKGAQ